MTLRIIFTLAILAGLGKRGQDRLAFGRFRSCGRFKVHGIDPGAKSFVGNECREIGGFQTGAHEPKRLVAKAQNAKTREEQSINRHASKARNLRPRPKSFLEIAQHNSARPAPALPSLEQVYDDFRSGRFADASKFDLQSSVGKRDERAIGKFHGHGGIPGAKAMLESLTLDRRR